MKQKELQRMSRAIKRAEEELKIAAKILEWRSATSGAMLV
jgi:hypothetical protein